MHQLARAKAGGYLGARKLSPAVLRWSIVVFGLVMTVLFFIKLR